MKKIIILILLTSYYQSSYAQKQNGSTTLIETKKIDTVLNTYKKLRVKKIDTLLNLTKEKTSLVWLNLLPNVSYDIDRDALNLGISLSQFARYAQQKQRNKIERLKLKESLESRLENDLIRLEAEYMRLKTNTKNVKSEVNNFSLYNEVYLLKKEQYTNNKINLEIWLNFQKTYNAAYQNLENRISILEQSTIKFYSKIKSPADKAELNILYEISKQLKSFRHEQR